MSTPRWRVGSKVHRTLYVDDVLVGLMDTPELAAQVVAAVSRAEGEEDPNTLRRKVMHYRAQAEAERNKIALAIPDLERIVADTCTSGYDSGIPHVAELARGIIARLTAKPQDTAPNTPIGCADDQLPPEFDAAAPAQPSDAERLEPHKDKDGDCSRCGLPWPDERETLEPHECPPGFRAALVWEDSDAK